MKYDCHVPDINYNGLGGFAKLPFGNEADVLTSLHWLDLVGRQGVPRWGTSIKLAQSYERDHPTQHNPCIVVYYAPHLGVTESQTVKGLVSLGGNLRYPNTLVNAIVVSHKDYTALVKDKDGRSDENSETINEFHAADGQVFMGFVSVQIAHAYMEFINTHPLKFSTHDPVAALTPESTVRVPMEALPMTEIMKDLSSSRRLGTLRTGADIFTCPEPDANDPHWKINPVSGVIESWEAQYIQREDWGSRHTFYKSSVTFQKQFDRVHRVLNMRSGVNEKGRPVDQINRLAPYDFPNGSRTTRTAAIRGRADQRLHSRG